MTLFSVVIPWSNRPELRRTLDANGPMLARHGAEVVVVNCGGEARDAEALLAGYTAAPVRQVALHDTAFNRCLARNVGLLCSTGRILFFLDCDIILRSDIFAEAMPLLEGDRCFVSIRNVYESQPRPDRRLRFLREKITTKELIRKDGRRAIIEEFKGGDGSHSGPGLLLVNRADLLSVGAYNSALQGWGFEDVDLIIRLQFALGLRPVATGEVVHLTHGDDTRGVRGGSRQDDTDRNMMVCLENYERDVFDGTYADDVRLWQPRIEAAVG